MWRGPVRVPLLTIDAHLQLQGIPVAAVTIEGLWALANARSSAVPRNTTAKSRQAALSHFVESAAMLKASSRPHYAPGRR